MSQFLKVARLLPLGSFVLISLSVFGRGIIRVSLIITPTERICMFFRFFLIFLVHVHHMCTEYVPTNYNSTCVVSFARIIYILVNCLRFARVRARYVYIDIKNRLELRNRVI